MKSKGVTSIFVDETENVTGEFSATQENISYLADDIVFLRHLELQGELRKTIGVVKDEPAITNARSASSPSPSTASR